MDSHTRKITVSTCRVPGHNPCYQPSLDYPPPVPNGARHARGPPQPGVQEYPSAPPPAGCPQPKGD